MLTIAILVIFTFLYSKYYHLRSDLNTNSVLDSFNIVFGVLSIGLLHVLHALFPLTEMFFADTFVYIFPDGSSYVDQRPTLASLLCLDFLQIGLPEELVKFSALSLAFYLEAPKNRREAMYRGACVGLGFALLENYMYVDNLNVPIEVRLLLPTLLHASLGAIMGFYLFNSKENNFYRGLILCTFIHGLYDFICMVGLPVQISTLICSTILVINLACGEKMYQKASD